MAPYFEEDLKDLIGTVEGMQAGHPDPRSIALVITHLENALLRYQHANR